MLPLKVFQLDYQDFSNLVWNHIPKIELFSEENKFSYDIVVSKLRNGVITGSILANYFGVPLGVIEAPRGTKIEDFRFFWPKDLQNKERVNVLLVDSICGTGQTLKDITLFLNSNNPNINLTTYVTLVDSNAKTKPDIIGEIKKEYIQPPWEWRSFTPQSHLQRLDAGNIKAAIEKEVFIGFSSIKCKENIENATGKFVDYEWMKIFNNFANDDSLAQAVSGISSINLLAPTSFSSYKTTFKKVIEEKVEFILSNGVSHYIEESMEESLLISQKCPVTHIFFFDGQNIHKIYCRQASFNDIKS